MAMAVRAGQALHCAPSFSSCVLSVGSAPSSAESTSFASTFRPSSLSSSSSTIATGGLTLSVSRVLQESSRYTIGAITKRCSRGKLQPGKTGGSLVSCRASYAGASGGAISPELRTALDNFVGSNKVVLFMKGNRNFPQCGFSNTCIQILNQCQVPYETVNILEDDSLRQGVKEYSNWPTYPQLYIDGEFYGGCDITLEAFKSGELKEALDKAMVS